MTVPVGDRPHTCSDPGAQHWTGEGQGLPPSAATMGLAGYGESLVLQGAGTANKTSSLSRRLCCRALVRGRSHEQAPPPRGTGPPLSGWALLPPGYLPPPGHTSHGRARPLPPSPLLVGGGSPHAQPCFQPRPKGPQMKGRAEPRGPSTELSPPEAPLCSTALTFPLPKTPPPA